MTTGRHRGPGRPCACALAIAALLGAAPGARAASIDTGNPDIRLRWDNTFKASAGWRVGSPDQKVAASALNPNVDAGDLAFDRGLINSRLDWLSEVDLAWKGMGARLSGVAWYDSVYQRDGNDFAGSTPNTTSALTGGRNNVFTPDTRRLMGKYAEVSDAFVYGSTDLGDDHKLTVRAGRHTQLYGETLFLGANGIAYAQGPVDLIRAFSQPNAQFKEVALPVGQVSANLSLSENVSVGAYYQFQWRPLRLPATGSYYSPADFVGDGADLLLTPTGGAANRSGDRRGSNTGQFGGRVKFRLPGSDTEFGLYAARYHEKSPIPVLDASTPGAFNGGSYALYYQKGIETYGASASTLVGETNVAGEVSVRRRTPLAPLGDLVVTLDPSANNSGNAPYALGNTLHANVSAISVFPATALWQGASVVGELAYNHLMAVTHNPATPVTPAGALNATHTRDHFGARVVFQPEYFQVLPQLDLQVPIGLGYGLAGRSAVFQLFPEHAGDLSVGLNFEYQKLWRFGLQATHYVGSAGAAPTTDDPTKGLMASYRQYYRDRDTVSLWLQRSF
ncbi:DUF1302 domain-containing protein [Derxia lacustris]|uniref:DUF1302 domain-containing protein n=1 Tax=Derxia lacustris TaxID=764842 RepID=UPI000A173B09|nr:DUF1302 domain-containing protein [Derxia lacustris]